MNETSSASAAIPHRAIFFLSLGGLAVGANLRVCDPLLPQVAGDFGVTTGQVSIIVSSFAIAFAVLQAFFGPFGDRHGKYKVICWSLAWASVGVTLCALAPNLGLLTAARLVAATGAAAIIPLSMAWIGDVVPYEARQGVLARFVSGQITGFILGQSAGGIVGEHFGWRAAFVLIAALHVIAAAGLARELRFNAATRHVPPADAKGVSPASILRGLAALWAVPWVRVILTAVLLEGAMLFGAFTFVGAHLKQAFDIGYGWVGAMLGLFGGGGLTYAFFAGRLVARLGEPGLVRAGALLLGAAFATIALAPVPAVAAAGIYVVGFGFYCMHNTLQTHATQMAPQARGAAVSFFAQVFFLGQASGVALNGLAVDRLGATPGFFVAAAGLPLLGLWLAARLGGRAAA